jgi:ribose/xylose/arabinose/galactoside ABC-type transport system permease subunit
VGAPARHAPHRALWPLLGILALVVANVAFDLAGGRGVWGPGTFLYLSFREGIPAGAVIDVLNYGAVPAIVALGMAPVIAARGIDLSVGSVMAISAAAGAQLVAGGAPSWVAIAGALAAAGLCGGWNALLVAGFRVQPFVATLVLMIAGRGIAQMITGSQITTFHDPALEFIGLGRPGWLPLPFPFLLALALLLGTGLTLRKTALGLLLEAVGGNPEAARLSGVRSRALIAGTYIFSGLCAGLAGLIAAANIKAADPFHAGQNMELAAIFGAVAGGTPLAGGRFSLRGAFAGGLLMQCLITTMYARGVRSDVAPLPQALVILAVCVLGSGRVRLRRAPQ